MEKTDLHTHTYFSHGKNSPEENAKEALNKGVQILGFSEHSPRPEKFSYPKNYDYREKLLKEMPEYKKEIFKLKEKHEDKIKILYGIEQDYFPRYEKWIKDFFNEFRFEYKIGSVHFLDEWGFDYSRQDWEDLEEDEIFQYFEKYFLTLEKMANSKLFNIAAHLDLIKIFAIESFKKWRKDKNALDLFEKVLKSILGNGMSLEISSAGLRKPCEEIYPCEEIMKIAKELKVPITISSDAHSSKDIGDNFENLLQYAKSFGYSNAVYFENEKMISLPFF